MSAQMQLEFAETPEEVAAVLEKIRGRVVTPWPDCTLWAGAVDQGYGRMWIRKRSARVHRVMWEMTNGPIPADMVIDHLCRVRYCVNPAHMELVTAPENKRRGAAYAGTTQEPYAIRERTACKNGHAYTDQTMAYRKGPNGRVSRRCLVCQREWDRRKWTRKKAARASAREEAKRRT